MTWQRRNPLPPIRDTSKSLQGHLGSSSPTADPNPVPNIVVSASHLPPSAPSSPPSSVTALETRSQKHTRDSFFATMDPMMKAYLDKMNDDAVARATKQDVDNKAILKAVATQSAWIDALVSWKPELEARFA
ncbi:hypothetical protein D1007_09496 [Hordeum vulgare]|nr:hypothetical protein D1007_09496 [Hordeum vulgare]